MQYSRRRLLETLCGAISALWIGGHDALADFVATTVPGNFAYIYGRPDFREEFRAFLVNVFHLYPEDELHAILTRLSARGATDEEIYKACQGELPAIEPLLANLRYALPALQKQKGLIAEQTVSLLGKGRAYEGYLELGSTGRYLDSLEERLDLRGDTFLIAARPPTYSATDIVDRGQLLPPGAFIDLNHYDPSIFGRIPPGSLDLVTVYIGFHHCPLHLRAGFMDGVSSVMKPGGYLVVRDHDVTDERMRRMVALAHDVFNLGTHETWAYNQDEFRGFYPLQTLDSMLTSAGFRGDGRRLFQAGDPTHNALLLYRKT